MNPKHPTTARASLAIAVAAAVVAGCGKPEPAAPPGPSGPVQVGVHTVATQDLTLTTELPGRTSALRVAEVWPQVNGILQKRLFTEGANVKEGEPLYQIDAALYEAQLNKAQATLRSAEGLAKRYEGLRKTNAISQQEYDDAIAAWRQAEADVEMARINMVYTKVLSPITGRIGRSAVTEGALVTNGQPLALATVQQIDPIYVDLTQSMSEILRLQRALEEGSLKRAGKDATQVTLTLEDGTRYPLAGTLSLSEISVDQGTGSVAIRAKFPNPDGKLRPGMFVHATLQAGVRNDAILIPQQAVMRDAKGKPVTWVVNADNTVVQREIETARTVGNTWLVDKGLQAGDRVVTEGLQRLQRLPPGTPVEASDATNVDMVTRYVAPGKAG